MKQNLFTRFSHGSRHKIVLLSLMGGVSSLCGVYLALLSKDVLDAATGQTSGNLLHDGLLLGGVILFQLFLQAFMTMYRIKTMTSLRFKLQTETFEQCLHKQKLALDHFHSGELVNRISGDTAMVADGIVGMIPSLVSVVAQVLFSFCALLFLDPVLAMLCVAAGVLMMAGARLYRRWTRVLFQKSRECDGKLYSFLQEISQNIAVVKAFSVYGVAKRQLGLIQDTSYDLTMRKSRASLLIHISFYLVMTAGYYLALGWGAWKIYRGVMTFGTLTAILGLTGDITMPFKTLSGMFPQYAALCTSAERLDELEELPLDEDLPPVDVAETYRKFQKLCLQDVSFTYGNGDVLKGVNAEFPKNTMTAITGESGAGKSTMLNLLTGILQPTAGCIYLDLDGVRVDLTSAYRGLFAYVPQDFLLLSGDVLENITLFDAEPDMDRFQEAVTMAELGEVIDHLPQGIHTFLGEGGGRLSGGQRQRMALARALYSRAEILLLDEATSALSNPLEERILKTLRQSGRTVIFVTHRRTAAELCDRILVKKDGLLYETE